MVLFFRFYGHWFLSFGSDCGLELIDRRVVLHGGTVYRGGCQFGIGVGIESHHHFGAVRRIGVVECDCGCPFLESEHAFDSCDFECHSLTSFGVVHNFLVTLMPGSRDIPHIPPVGMVVRHPDPPFSVHEPPCRARTASAAVSTVADRCEDTSRSDLRLAASSRHLDAHIADSRHWVAPAAAIPAAVADTRTGRHIPVRGCRMAFERDMQLVPAFPAVAWRTDVVVHLAVERSVVELAVPVPALVETEPAVVGLEPAVVESLRVPPSLRRDLHVPLISSARQAARRLSSSHRVWRTCVPR